MDELLSLLNDSADSSLKKQASIIQQVLQQMNRPADGSEAHWPAIQGPQLLEHAQRLVFSPDQVLAEQAASMMSRLCRSADVMAAVSQDGQSNTLDTCLLVLGKAEVSKVLAKWLLWVLSSPHIEKTVVDRHASAIAEMAARILPLNNPWGSLTVAECGISLVQQLARVPQAVTDTAPAWLPSLWRIALLEARPPDIPEEAAARCQSKALACWLSITRLVSPLPREQLPVLLLELNAPGTGLVPRLRRFMQCCFQSSAGRHGMSQKEQQEMHRKAEHAVRVAGCCCDLLGPALVQKPAGSAVHHGAPLFKLFEKSFLYGGDDGGVVTATLEQWQRIIITFVAHGQQTKRQKLLSDPLECLIIKDPRPGVQQAALDTWVHLLTTVLHALPQAGSPGMPVRTNEQVWQLFVTSMVGTLGPRIVAQLSCADSDGKGEAHARVRRGGATLGKVLHVLSGTSSRVAPALVILVHRAVLAHIPESTGAAQRSSLPVRAAPVLPGQVPLLQLVPDFVQVLKAALAAPDQDAQQLKVTQYWVSATVDKLVDLLHQAVMSCSMVTAEGTVLDAWRCMVSLAHDLLSQAAEADPGTSRDVSRHLVLRLMPLVQQGPLSRRLAFTGPVAPGTRPGTPYMAANVLLDAWTTMCLAHPGDVPNKGQTTSLLRAAVAGADPIAACHRTWQQLRQQMEGGSAAQLVAGLSLWACLAAVLQGVLLEPEHGELDDAALQAHLNFAQEVLRGPVEMLLLSRGAQSLHLLGEHTLRSPGQHSTSRGIRKSSEQPERLCPDPDSPRPQQGATGELEAEQGTPPQGKQSLAATVPPAQLQHWVKTWQDLAAAANAVGSRKRPLRWQHCCELLALLLSSMPNCSASRGGPLAVCVAATATASVAEEVAATAAQRVPGPPGQRPGSAGSATDKLADAVKLTGRRASGVAPL